ncbi:MAG: hypothetical protein DRP45_10995 [Candidatus Zixiibacteriota bacterium]|nr:MAG: hypothetical protein DRP45_10995 [candidate division Zixibacteria bacterium]
MKKILVFALKVILTVAVLYFVGRQVWDNWDEIGTHDWQVDYFDLVLSLILAQAALFFFSTSWKSIVSGFGHRVTPTVSFKICYLSNLGRYIPGKVWQVFGMLYLAKKEGVPEEQTAASFVLFQLFTIPASILVYVLAAQIEPAIMTDKVALLGRGGSLAISALMLAICAVLIFWPQPILKGVNKIFAKLGRPTASFELDKSVAALVFAGYFAGWILFGLAFWLFLRSILGNSAPSATAAVGLYNVAYQIGYLALFAPGGFGPREFVMGALLIPFVGPIAAAVAVAARIWSVLIDFLAAVIALCIRK